MERLLKKIVTCCLGVLFALPLAAQPYPESQVQQFEEAQRKADAYDAWEKEHGQYIRDEQTANEKANWDLLKTLGEGLITIYQRKLEDDVANQKKVKCLEGDCYSQTSLQLIVKDKVPFLYHGDFKNGKFDGFGKMLLYQHGKYELLNYGSYKNGLPDGLGMMYEIKVRTHRDLYSTTTTIELPGPHYFGNFSQGLRSGDGTLLDGNEKKLYEGQWSNDQPNGFGKEYDALEKIKFEGQFLNGKPSGQGRSFYDNGVVEKEGTWVNGKLHGNGKSYYSNGQLEFEGNFVNGAMTGDGKVFDREGKLKFEGVVKWNGQAGKGVYRYPDGGRFEGKWATFGQKPHQGLLLQGRVINDNGRRERRFSFYEVTGQMGELLRSIGLFEINGFGGIGAKQRFQGINRNYLPPGEFYLNYEAKASLIGPRVLKWNRVFGYAFLNSRASTFASDTVAVYLPSSILVNAPVGDNFHKLDLRNPPDVLDPPQVTMVTKELGVGLSLYIPRNEETSFDVGAGILLYQNSNLRFASNAVTTDSLAVGPRVIKNVLAFKSRDYFAEFGYRLSYIHLSLRTHFRSPVAPNSNLPLYDAEGNGFTQRFIGLKAFSIRPELNISIQLPLGHIPNRYNKLAKYIPFRDPK